jgi:OOP family OmpA-OmpF porin
LNRVYDVLSVQTQTHIRLEISGHTDNVGSKVANYRLSDSRAQSVVSYLVGKGIDPSRLTSKGYADTKPIESNATEEGRTLNRRVEFVVIQ